MISIVIPTFNREKVIERCIESILKQTYKDIEIIIVDDNSQDNTEEVVKNINSDKIKYYKLKENKGACYARNYGIKVSNGEYIAFQDSDDEWLIEKLEKQLNYLLLNNLDIVSCKIKRIKKDSTSVFPSNIKVSLESLYLENAISTQTILGKKECFNDIKFDNNLPRYQDWDLVINLAKKYKIGIIDEVLVNVYFQENSITKDPKKAIKALEIFLEKHNINSKTDARYNSLLGLYKLQNHDDYKENFRRAFLKNPLNPKIIFDFALSSLNLKKYHYNFYLKRGRFK